MLKANNLYQYLLKSASTPGSIPSGDDINNEPIEENLNTQTLNPLDALAEIMPNLIRQMNVVSSLIVRLQQQPMQQSTRPMPSVMPQQPGGVQSQQKSDMNPQQQQPQGSAQQPPGGMPPAYGTGSQQQPQQAGGPQQTKPEGEEEQEEEDEGAEEQETSKKPPFGKEAPKKKVAPPIKKGGDPAEKKAHMGSFFTAPWR